MKKLLLFTLALIVFGCTKEVKNNQTSTTGTKTHILKYIAESPVKTRVRYYNKTGATVDDFFTGNWEYEAQIETQNGEPFYTYLNLAKEDNRDESKITGKILLDGKVVQEGSSPSSVSCSFKVQ
jgi:hypothetical protein